MQKAKENHLSYQNAQCLKMDVQTRLAKRLFSCAQPDLFGMVVSLIWKICFRQSSQRAIIWEPILKSYGRFTVPPCGFQKGWAREGMGANRTLYFRAWEILGGVVAAAPRHVLGRECIICRTLSCATDVIHCFWMLSRHMSRRARQVLGLRTLPRWCGRIDGLQLGGCSDFPGVSPLAAT